MRRLLDDIEVEIEYQRPDEPEPPPIVRPKQSPKGQQKQKAAQNAAKDPTARAGQPTAKR